MPLKGNIGSSFIAQLGTYLNTLTVLSVSWWLTQPCLCGSIGSTSCSRYRVVKKNSAVQITFCPLTYLRISVNRYLLVTPDMIALPSILYNDSSDVTHISNPADVGTL